MLLNNLTMFLQYDKMRVILLTELNDGWYVNILATGRDNDRYVIFLATRPDDDWCATFLQLDETKVGLSKETIAQQVSK